jgi:transcriptional regulator with XRE-family HTH domain
MNFAEQLARRRDQLKRTNASLADITGSTAPHLSTVFTGKKDAQGSTLSAIADALDATWVLVPKHLIPEVERLLSGKTIGPDKVPSAMERVVGRPLKYYGGGDPIRTAKIKDGTT